MIRYAIPAVASILVGLSWAIADPPVGQRWSGQTPSRPLAVPDANNSDGSPSSQKRPDSSALHELFGADRPGRPRSGEHPLKPVLRWAKEVLPVIEELKDYSATFVKREQVDGKVGKRQTFFIKIRHKPFSVYIRGLAPAAIKGQQAIYVAGRNNGKLWAHPIGLPGMLVRAILVEPNGMLAMCDQRYPITEIGILNMVRRMVSVAEQDLQHDECEVRFFSKGKINDRVCTWFEAVHPVSQRFFHFHLARVFVDDQLKIPIRYEAYTWPDEPGGPPVLLEEYNYLNLKLNNGFSDEDFSIENPAYHFR
ncbi:MAG: DUF1571 domain-containing protein [Thermoguttaceae bacterium]